MKIARRDIVLWVLLCGGVGTLWGAWLECLSWGGAMDFRAVYSSARCLLHHRDPYDPRALRDEFLAEGGKLPTAPDKLLRIDQGLFTCINLPTAFLLIAPLALLPWGIAHWLWMLLIVVGFMLAAYLMFLEAGRYATGPPLILIGILLLDLGELLVLGNLAGIVVSLCVIAAWCLLNGTHARIAVVCLAVALLLKPHDAGFIWLYFLLAPGPHRKRALQALLLTTLLAAPAVLWASAYVPAWPQELKANLSASSSRGSLNDPGPASISFNSPDALVNLQAAFSVYRDDPHVYNPLSYAVCGVLILAIAARTRKAAFDKATAWLALSSLAALTMLPTYHRGHDAKLLLLTTPACALLGSEKGWWTWAYVALDLVAIGATAVLPSTFLEGALRHSAPQLLAQLAPLSLLTLCVVSLCLYWRRTSAPELQRR